MHIVCISKDITRELVIRVIGLHKTLLAKGALEFKKMWPMSGRWNPTKLEHGKRFAKLKLDPRL